MNKTLAFQPLKIPYGTKGKTLDFKNRLMIPPMVAWVSKDGFVNNFHVSRYNAWAAGGYGSIIMEVTSVHPNGRISPGDLGLWDDKFIPKFKELIDSVHCDYYNGVKIGVQIGHAGRKASSRVPQKGMVHLREEDGGFPEIVSCSALAFGDSRVPRELSKKEIIEMEDLYVDACERAVKCGVDFVEIHGAHGYLVNQFLCESTNKRSDEYGGSFENRSRFLLNICEKFFQRVGEFPLFVRLSVDELSLRDKDKKGEFEKIRWKVEDTLKLVGMLIDKGVCFIDCSAGGNQAGSDWSDSKPLWMVKYSHEVKKKFADKIKTSCVGEINYKEQVEGVLKAGKADVVQMGRQSLVNPSTPVLFAQEYGFGAKDVCSLMCPQHSYAIYRLMGVQEKRKKK